MSYILEALKKSDRERKQGEIPDLQSDHALRSSGPGKRDKRPSLWKWLLLCFLLVLAALVLSWGMQSRNVVLEEKIAALEESVVKLKEQTVPEVTPLPAVREEEAVPPLVTAPEDETGLMEENILQPVIEEETVAQAVEEPSPVEQEAGPSPQPVVEEEVVEETAESLPLIQDLPSTVQQSLPQLKLAGHVYSKEPAKRMIMINNRICREGDLVDTQLYLEQILWEGVVLRYQELRFRMNIF